MRPRAKRAVAAGFSAGMDAICPMLAGFGFERIERAADGVEALRLVRETNPDLAVADAVLPGMDGVEFVRRAREMKLLVRPALLLLKPPGLSLPGQDRLEALGATALDAPPEPKRLGDILAKLERLAQALPPEKAARLEGLLDDLGLPAHRGRDCLARAIALAWADRRMLRDLRGALYPRVAAATGLEPAQAERAMRHAIDAAWRTGPMEQQHKIFGDTIDAKRGKPTCGEMIAQLADILRWEG